MRHFYDAVVIGTGISGLTCAIHLKKKGLNVAVMTKEKAAHESNTYYAQGGIVAARDGDSADALEKDILKAGCSYNRREAVNYFSENAPSLVFDFLVNEVGIDFNRSEDGSFHYTGEAAHSMRRVLHFEDHTGDKIENSLIAHAESLGISIFTGYSAIDIITNDHHSLDTQEIYSERDVLGVYALNIDEGEVETFFSSNVVLATGGIGNIYYHTTNPVSATGDGISMAYRAGADIINSEFIQFHPTCLFHRDIKRFLISESLRGEGARIKDHDGVAFMNEYSEMGDLAPRDVVSRAIYDRMAKSGKEYMFLDLASFYDGDVPIEKRFSNIYSTCLSGGLDITKESIPVVPAAHYMCGGIKVDIQGRSSLNNLYAIGEVACTGIHGANRLASTSLLEGLLWGKVAAEDIVKRGCDVDRERLSRIPDWKKPVFTEEFDPLLIDQDMKAIQLTMWNYAGIIRTVRGLKRAEADLDYHSHRVMKFYKESKIQKEIIELRNAVVSSSLIVKSALRNRNSVGCHYLRETAQDK